MLAVALLAGGCSVRGSEYQYVRSRATGTYLKLPESWHVAEIPGDGQMEFGRFFDGSKVEPQQTPMTSERPTGFVQVRSLSERERDVVSLELLRNAVFEIDAGVAEGSVDVISYDQIEQGEFRGQRLVFETATGTGTARIAQVALLDPGTTRFHLLVVGCSARCYDKNRKHIDAVIDSLTVKET